MENPLDKFEAQSFFELKYPEIVYDEITDSYKYRDFEFDYFKAAIGTPNQYLLVDKIDSRLWLCTYGEKEEMWENFVKEKQKQ